jgi:hypothetical protein
MANVLSEMGAELVIPNVVKPTVDSYLFFPKRQFIFLGSDSCSKEASVNQMNPSFRV